MWKKFGADRRGSTIENYGLTGAAIALCIIPAASMFEKNYDADWVQSKLPVITAAAAHKNMSLAARTDLDYLPTGSVPGKQAPTIVLDPCTGKVK